MGRCLRVGGTVMKSMISISYTVVEYTVMPRRLMVVLLGNVESSRLVCV